MEITRQWAIVSVVTGIMTVIVYTLLSILPGPFILQVVLVSAFGPLLAAASLGLYHVLVATGNTILLQLAVMFNILGASIFTMMGLVQLAIRFKLQTVGENTPIPPALPATLVGVQLGMDVAWDIFIGLGTLLFALNMIRDPRFGWIPGLFGILIALGLIVLNLLTFPIPPAEKNLIDLGPFVGLWYLAVTILVIKWLLG
jgi:hypothetical protein